MEKQLLELQKKVGVLTKDKKNPFFKSNYLDINTIIEVLKPILNELGLVMIQPLGMTPEGRMNLTNEERRAKFPYESYDVPFNNLIVRKPYNGN